jgi:hypothetical protein
MPWSGKEDNWNPQEKRLPSIYRPLFGLLFGFGKPGSLARCDTTDDTKGIHLVRPVDEFPSALRKPPFEFVEMGWLFLSFHRFHALRTVLIPPAQIPRLL